MRAKHLWVVVVSVLAANPIWAAPVSVSTTPAQEPANTEPPPPEDQTTSTDESEAKDIIPRDAETIISSQPITPVSAFPEKTPYEQAKDELIRALELWNSGHAEAASDTALEAYDDFMELRRVPGVKRATIRQQMHQAASVYVEAGIAYIRSYVKRTGGGKDTVEEGRARLEDLRDVAMNYNELNKMLNSAIVQLGGTPPPPPPPPRKSKK